MEAKTAEKIVSIQTKAMENIHYANALQAYRNREKQFIRLLTTLPKDQRDIIEDYIGLFYEMHLYLLESACESGE